MWTCRKCEKPVFFAERKQSLGYDWHPECLRCEECQKRLNPGQHAEHKGVPYCHIPCYSALFGPTLFGHGSQVESHRSFGKVENRLGTTKERSQLESKLKSYNQYSKNHEIKCKERNGKLILEGVLRIYWGVNNLIHLKEDDDQRAHVRVRKRNSYRKAIDHDLDDSDSDSPPSTPVRVKRSSTVANTNLHDDAALGAVGNGASSSPSSKLGTSDQCDGLPNEVTPSNGTSQGVTSVATENFAHSVQDDKDTCLSSSDINSSNHKNVTAAAHDDSSLPPNNGNEVANSSAVSVVSDNTHAKLLTDTGTVDKLGHVTSNGDEISKSDVGAENTMNDNKGSSGDAVAASSDNSPPVRVRKMASSRSRTKLRRRCSINGHYYDRETSVFKPPYGSASNVWTTSCVNSPEVINMLLDKFRVENSPKDFALYIVRDNGETKRIQDQDYPLLVRVMLGPHEDVAKVFLMDNKTNEISNEVAQFLNFTYAELNSILRRYREEEDKEVDKIITKFRDMKYWMRRRMAQLIAQRRQQKEREAAAAAAAAAAAGKS